MPPGSTRWQNDYIDCWTGLGKRFDAKKREP